ncbi:MAG: polyphosphate kinase 2 family protein [Thiohalocapsa sp.]|nr:polyphosphate kinase 2 family protein [Thiohalocapsa sp.]MCG6942478.1 polyphosphate kinase 2 family protein [Thiohalocapsa sp.]
MKYSKRFRVEPGSKVKLADIDAGFKDRHEDRESAQSELEQNSRRLAELQYLMYAEDQRSLLIVLQAMDAGGKDGVVNHVISAMNPQGCAVHAFKAPSAEELAHDYLWRIHRVTPAKGQVTIFNRSHYEDVLVVRVHDLVPKKVWSKRYDEINDFEQFLTENGTHVVKFFLHIDAEEQLARFKQRLDDPGRHWKISESDYSERAYWDQYQAAFEDVLEKCSTEHAPWYVIPANHKWFRNLAVSQILVETLDSLGMKMPPARVDIAAMRAKYHAAEALEEGGAAADGADASSAEREAESQHGKKAKKHKDKKKS